MLNKINEILVTIEDAIDSESWELVRHAQRDLNELYERLEIEDTWDSSEYED